MCLLIILLGVMIVAFIIFAIRSTNREGFPVGERSEMPCAVTNYWDYDVIPNSVLLVVQGYNYNETPRIYRDDLPIIPLEFSSEPYNLTYYFIVQVPDGRENFLNHSWAIFTQEKIKPIVTEVYSQTPMNAILTDQSPDHYMWALSA